MPSAHSASRLAAVLAGGSLLAAIAWLVSRVWLGLDFADEMQYYGQIVSLTRTGRFFQDDLFLQQTGYVFLLPFFKLHALCFPDQAYLLVFGRLLLLAAYAAVGVVFWRAASRLGDFSGPQKIAGLAVFFSWVPFQIFAFSYNTTAYLLIIVLVAVWLTRYPEKFPRYVVTLAGLLTLLTFTHPAAGLVLIVTAAVEALVVRGWRSAWHLVLATAAGGLAVLAVMRLLHGPAFWADLLDSMAFSRSFGVGEAIRQPLHLASWFTLLATAALFVWRQGLGRPFSFPFNPPSPPTLRWVALSVFVVLGGALLGLLTTWAAGYWAASACLGGLMLLAASVAPSDGQAPSLRLDNLPLMRWAMIAAVGGGIVAVLATMLFSVRGVTGYFAITVYGVLLVLLAGTTGREGTKTVTGLAVIGTVTGAVFAFTSGNGLSSFGVGAAGILPYLALVGARNLQRAGTIGAAAAGPVLALLLLVNGMRTPYGEQEFWREFLPVQGVPAFRGIRTSALKIEAIERFKPIGADGALRGRRVQIIGPHPWLYFVLGGQPATPILFMKFDGNPRAYELAAARFFQSGEPDVLVVTDTFIPPPIAAKYQAWAKTGCTVSVVPISFSFNHRFVQHTGYGFGPEVYVLSRPVPAP